MAEIGNYECMERMERNRRRYLERNRTQDPEQVAVEERIQESIYHLSGKEKQLEIREGRNNQKLKSFIR